jgi:hypothetical protein
MNGDSKWIWKELVIAYFKDLPWNLLKGIKKSTKTFIRIDGVPHKN